MIDSNIEDDSTIYKTLLESTKAIPWKLDWKSMTFTYIGPQIETLLGWKRDSWLTANDWAARIHEEDRERVVNFCVSQSQAGIDHEADYRALTPEGDHLWIRDVVHVVRNDAGEVECLLGFMFDISERKKNELALLKLQQELEDLSYKDALTGVANRRMFDSILEIEWVRARQNLQPLSLILLDIDHFKQYNDRYGHLAGDDCLRRVAQILDGAGTRARDFFARFGGEEFVLVLPETDAESAIKIAERCRVLIAKANILHAAAEPLNRISISLGVGTVVPSYGDVPTTFLDRVDQRLYQAKQQGRDRAVSS